MSRRQASKRDITINMSNEDPYKPPESNSTSWKTFFWVTAALMALSIPGVATIQNLSIFDYLDFLISIAITVGLYGFAFYKPIGTVIFWRYFFYASAIESIIVSVLFPLAGIPVYGEATIFDAWYLIGSVYVIAMLYAIYQYAYRRPFIWHRN